MCPCTERICYTLGMNTSWLLLLIAILAEVVATTNLKLSQGFSKPLPSAMVVIGYALSFWLISLAMKTIPLSIAYAVWSGLGTLIIATIGVVFMHESMSFVKVLAIAMIVVGVVLLNLTTSHKLG